MVARRIPQGVLCVISALSFHELTTQVPHTIDVALERGTRRPRLDYPPTRFFWFSGPASQGGIEMHTLDGVPVRTYYPEKTLADCASATGISSGWTSFRRRCASAGRTATVLQARSPAYNPQPAARAARRSGQGLEPAKVGEADP